jgi:hypothetical protein
MTAKDEGEVRVIADVALVLRSARDVIASAPS